MLVDGQAPQSCQLPLSAAAGTVVVTIEGLAPGGSLHPLQRAFLDEQAAQCVYCTAGIIMVAKALLDTNPRPSDAEMRAALDGNLCRCGTHSRVLRAIARAAEVLSG